LQVELTEVASKETYEAGSIKDSHAELCIADLSWIIYPKKEDFKLRFPYGEEEMKEIEDIMLNIGLRIKESSRLAEKFMGYIGSNNLLDCDIDLKTLKN
jgi:hypothetical protein